MPSNRNSRRKPYAPYRPCIFCGDPSATPRGHLCAKHKTTDLATRLWRRVKIGSETECWPWLGGSNGDKMDYGILNLSTVGRAHKNILAHVAAWTVTYGDVPAGSCVLHHCDYPRCCNPSHLFLGSRPDNIHDMDEKGRRVSLSGERNGRAKLTADAVITMRGTYAKGDQLI